MALDLSMHYEQALARTDSPRYHKCRLPVYALAGAQWCICDKGLQFLKRRSWSKNSSDQFATRLTSKMSFAANVNPDKGPSPEFSIRRSVSMKALRSLLMTFTAIPLTAHITQLSDCAQSPKTDGSKPHQVLRDDHQGPLTPAVNPLLGTRHVDIHGPTAEHASGDQARRRHIQPRLQKRYQGVLILVLAQDPYDVLILEQKF